MRDSGKYLVDCCLFPFFLARVLEELALRADHILVDQELVLSFIAADEKVGVLFVFQRPIDE